MDAHAKAFREEAYEILWELESLLLELDESPDNTQLLDKVFGAFHTIKGSGAMFGFDAIAEFTHEIESTLEYVRQGIVPVSPELVSLALSARDKILQILDEEIQGLDEDAHLIISGFQQLHGESLPAESNSTAEKKTVRIPVTYRIRFNPSPDIFRRGTNPVLLLKELEELGKCAVVAHNDAIPALAELDPEGCYVCWDIVLTTESDVSEIRDVFLFVEEEGEISIEPVFEHVEGIECEDYRRLGEILLDRGDISRAELECILGSHKKLGEKLVDSELLTSEHVDAALSEQEHVRRMLRREREKTLTSIQVDAERIDHLVDLVGELVTVQARLTQKAVASLDPELQLIAESVQRLTEELRDNAMSIRMVPVGTLFSRVRRHVHDLSEELGKQVRLTTEGSATELDKTVIDQLNETLVHIVRNAIHHGIEAPAIRKELNKPVRGTVHLAARHQGTSVIIDISDDGAGLDPDRLKKLAVKKGVIDDDAELSDEECFALIHQPGFSTMEQADSVSGRGVGMDVVKRSIDGLRGTIDINSKVNTGTTISLHLPLTLAIIDGLLVQIDSEYYVFPLPAVEECVELNHAEAELSRERSMMTYRGEAFTYISLRDVLGVQGEPPLIEKIILVEIGGKKTGFSVDQVIGQHQTVIKSLSGVYGQVEGISGATILGDGTVALILDVGQLIVVQRNRSQHTPGPKIEYIA